MVVASRDRVFRLELTFSQLNSRVRLLLTYLQACAAAQNVQLTVNKLVPLTPHGRLHVWPYGWWVRLRGACGGCGWARARAPHGDQTQQTEIGYM